MKLVDVVDQLNLRVACGGELLDRDINAGYVSDLLSDVMGHAGPGDVWVTLQIHPNIIGVAVLRRLAGIILINGRIPEEDTVNKATAEKIPILVSELPAFELVGRLYELGIHGLH